MSTFLRCLVLLFAFAFLAAGLSFWISPERTAEHFGLVAEHVQGIVSLYSDLGGLFVGLAILCAAGAVASSRTWLYAAAVVLSSIVVGRVLGWFHLGAMGGRELSVELLAIAVTVLCARSTKPASERGAHRTRWILPIAGLVLVAGAAALVLAPAVQQELFDAGARNLSAKTNLAPFEDDALRVAIAGSSAPLPSRSRAKASVVVFAGGRFWVVDSGPESVENLVLWGIPLSRIGGVLLTHFHSDHIGDLGELQLQTWAGGRTEKLKVYGGPGVDGVVAGFNQAYALDQGYRTAHHGEQVMPSTTWGLQAVTVMLDGAPTAAKDRSVLVYDDGSLRITAIEVDHPPIEPAYAYRFDYKGRSAVVTGDLKYHPPLAVHAANVDLLVSEAISRTMTESLEHAAEASGRDRTGAIMHDVQDYHISPEEAARLANEAHARHLAFYHLLPAPDGWLPRQLFARGVNEIRLHDWTIADDGSLYTLPLGTRSVRIGRIDG